MSVAGVVKAVGVVDGAVLAVAVAVGNAYPQYKAVADQVVYVGGVVATAVAAVQHYAAPVAPKAA